jgi:metallo-beta-lactamase family protein
VGDPRNIILIVGFQAENTLGRRLVDYVSPLRILGDEFELKARVHTINALSAHADKDALNAWLGAITPPVTHAFAIHGEEPQVNAMGDLLRAHGAKNVHSPSPGERFTV